MEKYQTFGELIAERLNLLNISQRKLAQSINVDVSYISKIIKGKSVNPSFQVVMKIANELNISKRELEGLFDVTMENEKNITQNINKFPTFEEKNKVGEIIDILSEDNAGDLVNVSNVIKKIDELQNIRKIRTYNKKYYVIAYFDKDEIKILETNCIDNEFLRLYGYFLNTSTDSFLIVKNIELIPKDVTIITLEDLINLVDSMEEGEEGIYLKKYIQEKML